MSMENFTQEFTPGNIKAAMKALGAGSVDLYMADPHKIRVVPDFNIRVRNQKYIDRVRWIADSIKVNGYYKDKPITGFVMDENGESVLVATGGHRRLEGTLLAISEGAEIETIPVVIKPRGTSMEDLTVDIFVGNEGDGISLYEQAILCKRLAGYGRDSKTIAERMGFKSSKHVDNLLMLASAPSTLRQLVADELVTGSMAIDALNEHGSKAEAVLRRAIDKAGGKKATPKHLPDAEFKKSIKQNAPVFYSTLTRVQEDPSYSLLSPEVRTVLDEVLSKVKK